MMESYNPHVESLRICFFKLKPHGLYGTCFCIFAKQKKQLFLLGHSIFETSSSESCRKKTGKNCCRRTQEKDLTLQHNRVKVSQNRCLSIVGPRFLRWSFHLFNGFSDAIQHPRCPMYDEFNYTYIPPLNQPNVDRLGPQKMTLSNLLPIGMKSRPVVLPMGFQEELRTKASWLAHDTCVTLL